MKDRENGSTPGISNKTLLAVLAGIFLLAAGALAFFYWNRPADARVVVTVDGAVFGSYDLHKDQTVRIAPPDDSWHNTLEIRNGRATVIEADCDNQICVHTPPLTEDVVGIIVCLPHGVVVELREK